MDTTSRLTEPTMPDFFSCLSDENIKSLVMSAPPLKAPGADIIQDWVWKKIWVVVKNHVGILVLHIEDTGLIPQDWKEARTVMRPITSKPDYKAALAYRPIAQKVRG